MSRCRVSLVGLVALAGLLTPGQAEARINPLHVMTGGGVRTPRAEVILVLDVSSKMVEPTGSDCSGTQPDIDHCGDGVCSGVETYNDGPPCGANPTEECECPVDCLYGPPASRMKPPSMVQNCVFPNAATTGAGRLFQIKRAMRNVIPEFRTSASFALDTFPRHRGYYPYAKFNPPPTWVAPGTGGEPEAATIFLHEYELKYAQWIKDGLAAGNSAWDWTLDQPNVVFVVNNAPYARLDIAAGIGWPVDDDGAGTTVTISGLDSVYRRLEGKAYIDKRFAWAGHGHSFTETLADGTTYKWDYVGSFYAFPQFEVVDYWEGGLGPPGGYLGNPGDAQFIDMLAGGTYKGPVFVENPGAANETWWMHHKYKYDDKILEENPTSPAPEEGYVWPELYIEPSMDQADQDKRLGAMMKWLNTASTGGASTNKTSNNAPAESGILKAREHFWHRIDGTGPFNTWGADGAADCRKRFVIFLTNGKQQGPHPGTAIAALYNDAKTKTGQPIPTYVICMYPEDEGSCHASADAGDDGGAVAGSKQAATGASEAEITEILRETLVNALKGDFTTSAPGVTTISSGAGGTVIVDNVTLLPSTEWPGWKGHVRAVDLSQSPPATLWDAGLQLQGRTWSDRNVFTGYPNTWPDASGVGQPVRMVAADGTVNLDGTDTAKFGTSNKGIKQIWPKVITCATDADCPFLTLCGGTGNFAPNKCVPSNDNLKGVIQFIAGKDRPDSWKLGPVIQSVPATVGPPPKYSDQNVGDATVSHLTYEQNRKNRPRISYVLSNEGGLHAFHTATGLELFLYIVPDSLWRIFEVYKQGGQDPDPRNFKYVLASSVRVEDMPDPTVADGFVTQLLVTMGPGGPSIITLDITAPIGAGSTVLNTPAFGIVRHSGGLTVAAQGAGWLHGNAFGSEPLPQYLGETWSVPAVFYDYTSGNVEAPYAFGSGYFPGWPDLIAPHNNEFYFYFDPPVPPAPPAPAVPASIKAMHHNMVGTTWLPCAYTMGRPDLCHSGVLANTVGVVNETNKREIVATYQADLAGRLVRFPMGLPNIGMAQNAVELLGLDANYTGSQSDYPLHYPPAAYYEPGSGVTMLAINTHAYPEDQWDFDLTTAKPAPPAISRIGMLQDNGGAVGASRYCDIDKVCTCLNPIPGPACPLRCQPKSDGTCPTGCTPDADGCAAPGAPSANALPTSQPLLLKNATAGNRMEAFFLYYDPPPPDFNVCGDRVGDTWSIRMTYDGATWGLREAKKITETYGSGLTIVGRGKDLGMALTGIGEGAQAEVATYSGAAVGVGLGAGDVVTEGVREVN